MKWKQWRTAGVPVSHHVLDLCLADSQSQCVINFRLSPGPPHNHKWSKWNMVLPAICIADRLWEIRKYNEDNGAVCMTKKDFDLELCENSYRDEIVFTETRCNFSYFSIHYKTKKRDNYNMNFSIKAGRTSESMVHWIPKLTDILTAKP